MILLRKYTDLLQKNKTTAFLLVTLFIYLTTIYIREKTAIAGLSYLLTMIACVIITDIFTRNKNYDSTEIKKPKKETLLIFLFPVIGYLALLTKLTYPSNGIFNLFTVIVLLLFLFPVALGIYFLVSKYSLRKLGFNLKGLIIAPIIIALIGLVTYIVAPDKIGWKRMYDEMGITSLLFTGFISASLSEEFWRNLGQSRLGNILNNNALGWILATIFWALLHTAKWYAEEKNWLTAMDSAIRIIPIGLMWGYVTFRTKSIVPTIIIHGTNLWGLQNI